MNANSISRPVSNQSAQSWTPLLAAVLLAIALIVGVAGVAALTAKTTSTSSPMFVPQTLSDHPAKDLIVPQTLNDHPAKDLLLPKAVNDGYEWINGQPHQVAAPVPYQWINNGYEWINGQPHPVTAPVFVPQTPAAVPQSVNSHETSGFRSLQGVPYSGGAAGPSQLDHARAPGMGGH